MGRVVDVEPLSMETSVSTYGNVKGTQVTELITFVARPTASKGFLTVKDLEQLWQMGDQKLLKIRLVIEHKKGRS